MAKPLRKKFMSVTIPWRGHRKFKQVAWFFCREWIANSKLRVRARHWKRRRRDVLTNPDFKPTIPMKYGQPIDHYRAYTDPYFFPTIFDYGQPCDNYGNVLPPSPEGDWFGTEIALLAIDEADDPARGYF